jgi:hypothetical protein
MCLFGFRVEPKLANPKAESRNPKEVRTPNSEYIRLLAPTGIG